MLNGTKELSIKEVCLCPLCLFSFYSDSRNIFNIRDDFRDVAQGEFSSWCRSQHFLKDCLYFLIQSLFE